MSIPALQKAETEVKTETQIPLSKPNSGTNTREYNMAPILSTANVPATTFVIKFTTPMDRHNSQRVESDDTQTTDLNEQQDNELTEQSPVGTGIHHHQAGHADGSCRCEEGGEKTGFAPGRCCTGQHEQ